ncbi:MAG: ATP-binding protein [Christensenellaceae bacterium]|nr:ATP-binding protein [Christensenellaceae bacterium]
MENQIIDWKRQWNDDNLKCICGFANAEGGTLVVGKNDNGEVVADLKNPKKLSENCRIKSSRLWALSPLFPYLRRTDGSI